MEDYSKTYYVYRVYKNSNRRKIIRRHLSLDEARELVMSYPVTENSVVIFNGEN